MHGEDFMRNRGPGLVLIALAICARGWEAIRSATAKLSECFPELWRTARVMEGWLRKNPLDPSLSIKPGLVFLWTTSPGDSGLGHGHWSGLGRMRGRRFAAVLGVPVEHIAVRGLDKP